MHRNVLHKLASIPRSGSLYQTSNNVSENHSNIKLHIPACIPRVWKPLPNITSADPEGGTGGPEPPLENHKLYGFL